MRIRAALTILIAPLFLVSPAAGSANPEVIFLPDDWASEGIATAGNTFYAGSMITGSIYRGSLTTGDGAVFIEETGKAAVGLKADRRHRLLFVSGGFDGSARVYDLVTGAEVASYSLGGLINDVVVTRSAAYFTNTFGNQIYKIPIAANGTLGAAETITVTGPAGQVAATFGLNGIDATANGKTLIVCHTELGGLYTVNPTTGASAQIVLTSGALAAGTLDGILRVGHSIWVVENFANRLSKVRVSPDWSTGKVTATVTNPEFKVPATVARHGRWLAVVNTRFDLA
ncbi:MAG TPA: hypothetical protein VLI04_06180, partial [Nocardioidaceae bacterium]|nr:hypothetical protein [Nocardioidaceae bacterium]